MSVDTEKQGWFLSNEEYFKLVNAESEAYDLGYSDGFNEGYVSGQEDAGNKILL